MSGSYLLYNTIGFGLKMIAFLRFRENPLREFSIRLAETFPHLFLKLTSDVQGVSRSYRKVLLAMKKCCKKKFGKHHWYTLHLGTELPTEHASKSLYRSFFPSNIRWEKYFCIFPTKAPLILQWDLRRGSSRPGESRDLATRYEALFCWLFLAFFIMSIQKCKMYQRQIKKSPLVTVFVC